VDGKEVSVGSFVVPQGAKISLKEKALENQIVLQASKAPRLEVPDYLRKETEGGKEIGVLHAMPGTEHVPFQFDAGLFTEYYAARKA
jgi:small subunit ribosomal protein S4